MKDPKQEREVSQRLANERQAGFNGAMNDAGLLFTQTNEAVVQAERDSIHRLEMWQKSEAEVTKLRAELKLCRDANESLGKSYYAEHGRSIYEVAGKAPLPRIKVRVGGPWGKTGERWERWADGKFKSACMSGYKICNGEVHTGGGFGPLLADELRAPRGWTGPVEPWMDVINPDLLLYKSPRELISDINRGARLERLREDLADVVLSLAVWAKKLDTPAVDHKCPCCTRQKKRDSKGYALCTTCPIRRHTGSYNNCNGTPYWVWCGNPTREHVISMLACLIRVADKVREEIAACG